MAYHSQSLGRSLSVTSLEGIQVRLGEHFKPPEKVSLPFGYKEPNPAALLYSSQYSFETEKGFLTWLEAKKMAEAERAASKLKAKETEAPPPAAKNSPPLSNGILQPTNAQPGPSETGAGPPLAGLGGDIMTPVPLPPGGGRQAASTAAADRKRRFDLADFESNASDPFEATELETLNDIEELKSLLAFTAAPDARSRAVATEQPLHSPDLSLEADSAPTEEVDAITIHDAGRTVAFRPDKPRHKPQTLSAGPSGPASQPVPNGHQPVLPDVSRPNPDPFGRSRLPPIASSHGEPGAQPALCPGDASHPAGGQGAEEHLGQPCRARSPPPSYYAQNFALSGSSPNAGPIELPPSYPQSASLQAVSSTPYPDFDLENLSRYTPLPPSPHQSRTNSVDHGRVSPPDPVLDTLGPEDRSFVQTIASMGFPRSRTARAVQQLGHDDRLVVEWLCAVDRLCSQGYQEEKVELALSLHNSNMNKAQMFLLLHQRFEDLGFKSEDIRRELIVHDNNEDTVLNALTSRS